MLESEFQPSQLQVEVVKSEDPLSDGLSVVFDNTGEVLLGGKAYPTETQQLMMISKIGVWLAAQPK